MKVKRSLTVAGLAIGALVLGGLLAGVGIPCAAAYWEGKAVLWSYVEPGDPLSEPVWVIFNPSCERRPKTAGSRLQPRRGSRFELNRLEQGC